MLSLPIFLSFAASLAAAAGLTDASLDKHVNVLDLDFTFNAVKEAYWTGLPHHRRTPFALSPDGTRAFLAYLDESETDVHVQRVDPDTFAAVGSAMTISGAKEAGGLVAHNDGFALLTNEALPSGTADAPADSTPVPVLYRYTDGEETWKTFLGGPGVHAADGLSASPDLNGDLVFSEKTGYYGAYFVVTDYTTDFSGHYGDSVQYVSTNGTLETLAVSSSWGCSHNTGIAFEAADEVPYASICAEDSGDIWLNTDTRGMTNDGVKISNENTTNGASGEPVGGMSGSYSNLARFQGEDTYIFSWVSRGAVDLYADEWLGDGYVSSYNRTNGRNVAIATFSDKSTMVGDQASSEVGAASGDSQVNWITNGTADCSNAHAATFDSSSALITWEQIDEPNCDFIAMGCSGAFSGSYFQVVTNGSKVGDAVKSMDTYVAGDMVTMGDGRVCWPYVNLTWTLDGPLYENKTTTQMSFACISYGEDATASSTTAAVSSAVASSTVAVSSVASSSAVASAVASKVAVSSIASSSAVANAAVASTPVASSSAVSTAAVVSTPAAVSSVSSAVSVAAVNAATSSAVSVYTPAFATTLSTAVRSSSASSASIKEVPTAFADASDNENCEVQYVYV